ncbi:tetratricopeptide repeat protein 39B-like [Diorhabda carinulata]|uniref:tetratricopeptide repeat protein 39B-like n=1 Tax=Diorhabda carinulata TaxID=1163345 RepID=UPI0025A0B6C4|nr:tetratricopeptide repeat protein 39B-like [Diorhabda carinulata]
MSASDNIIYDSDDQDDFQDAEDTPVSENMPLYQALEEAKKGVDFFFNNQFVEAKSLMTPYANISMYHSLGHSLFLYMEAMLTFEPDAIKEASRALKQTMNVCNRYRKKNTFGESLGKMVKKVNFELFSSIEAHAELCHAESSLLKSLLTFVEDETLASFIKAGIKIRSCFNSYKECYQILIKKNWEKDPTKEHFEGGVRVGIGVFNLMISMLPGRVIKLLEFIGFSGSKQKGLQELYLGCETRGIRQVLSIMAILGYNLIALHVLSHREGDIKQCTDIIDKRLEKYPKSVWFLFFKGRLELLKGNLDASRNWYEKSWKSQNLWPQFHHICFWELVWVHCLRLEWREALIYSSELLQHSKWSRTMYSYQKAAILLMLKEDSIDTVEKEEIDKLMKDVPKYKQRIAGKSLPMEKFALKKAERYFYQNGNLILPVIELMFLWNLFKIFNNFSISSKMLKLIEKTVENLESNAKTTKYDNDNKALALLLQGACLRHMGSPLLALNCFETVISMNKSLVEDHYIIPYAIVELALVEWSNGNRQKAILALEDAKKNYTGYSLESRLHFRIHTALTEFKTEMKSI